jgi:hypothetical protein
MTTITQTACVVIPLYQGQLASHEQLALRQCLSVLSKHPILLATPSGLDVQTLLDENPNVKRETFSDKFFDGVAGYNRLMLSDEFYARFAQYEFILIYQLDAFVFSDQLLQWCSLDYDYIGAPWLPKPALPGLAKQAYVTIRRKLHRLLNKRTSNSPAHAMSQYQYFYSTGNGGFSLRRISKMRQVLAALDDVAELYRNGTCQPWAEDIFFSVEANRYRNRLRIPSAKQAAHFAWELHPATGSKLTGGKLPFGCHGWDKYYRNEWRPIFAQLGHHLDELTGPAIN